MNRSVVLPNDNLGYSKIFCKCTVAIDAENFKIRTDVHLTRQALLTMQAGNMRLDRNNIAFFYAGDHRTGFNAYRLAFPADPGGGNICSTSRPSRSWRRCRAMSFTRGSVS